MNQIYILVFYKYQTKQLFHQKVCYLHCYTWNQYVACIPFHDMKNRVRTNAPLTAPILLCIET